MVDQATNSSIYSRMNRCVSNTIFELNSIRIAGGHYPIRRVYHQQIGIYSSQENVEAAIRTFIERWQRQHIEYGDSYLGFIMYERLVNSQPQRNMNLRLPLFSSSRMRLISG